MKKTFILTLWSLLLLFLLASQASAQFDTDTPTVTPVPKFNIEGTPMISTVWMEIDDGLSNSNTANYKPTPTPNIVIKKPIKNSEVPFADSSIDIAPIMTPTVEIKPGSYTASSQSSSTVGSSAVTSAKPALKKTENAASDPDGPGSGVTQKEMATEAGSGPGPLRMLDLYQTGMQDYKKKDFDNSTVHLKKSLTIQDPTVPFYYYAEANAMLGVIYKFYRPDEVLSREYCERALKIDPTTKTAKKLIHEIGSSGTEAEQLYHQGIKLYESHRYGEAVTLLGEMVEQKDQATPSFYYAEADRTLGIIYHYYLKDKAKALKYYQAGLKIEPADQLAQKNMAKLLRH